MSLNKLDYGLIGSIIFTSIPTLFLLSLGNTPGMLLFFKIVFTFFFCFYFLFYKVGKEFYLITYTISQFPFIFFMKGDLYYFFITTIILALVWLNFYIRNKMILYGLFKNKFFKFNIIFFLIYFLLSWIITKDYSKGLKFVDLSLAIGLLPILSNNKYFFKLTVSLFGLISVLFALIIGSFGARYIGSDSELFNEVSFGGANPIGYGIPVALFLVLFILAPNLVVFKFFFKKKIIDISIIAISLVGLIVTTSRGSILAFSITILVLLLIKKEFPKLIKLMIIISISFVFYITLSKYFPEFAFAEDFIIGRAQDENIDLNRYSSNRIEMWEGVKNELARGNFVFSGAGPGNELNANYFTGIKMTHIYHALPLKFIVEIGLISTILFYVIFLYNIIQNLIIINEKKYSLNLIGQIFWLILTLSVTGIDMLSGLAYGLAFIQKSFENNKSLS